MLNLFFRAILLYAVLLIAMRLMGKRQLSELQPFEFAITLVAAELTCIPMADNSISITYGIIPILTLVFLNNLLTILANKSSKIRKLINGKPVIIISDGVIDCASLKKCGLNLNDLLESVRSQGFFDLSDIHFAILETNGQLSVLPTFAKSPATNETMSVAGENPNIPYHIIVEGKFMTDTADAIDPPVEKSFVADILAENNIAEKDVFLFSVNGVNVYIQTYSGKTFKLKRSAQ